MLSLASLLESLDEKNTWLFERIWNVFTPEELAATLERVEEIQRDGGETTANGSRKRTSGGVFLRILHEEYKDRYNPILTEQNKHRRKERQAKEMDAAKEKIGKMEQDILCPPELVGQLIGKNGQHINTLREKAPGVKVVVEDETGRVRIEGQPEEAQAARAMIQEAVSGLILRTHAGYAQDVLLSDFMVAGQKCDGELPDLWAATLYTWVASAIQQTSAKQFSTTILRLVTSTPKEVREEIAAQLEAQPELLGKHGKVRATVLAAITGAESPKSTVGEGSTACTETLEEIEQVECAPEVECA